MRTSTIPLLLAAFSAQFSLLAAEPLPQSCEGDCYSRDPSIIKRHDGTYFMFNTLDLISIRTSKSLSGPWTNIGSVLQQPSIIDKQGRDVLWAPDVSYIRGLYYCFYAVSVSGSQNSSIGYATSKTMEPGSWTDHGEVISSQPGAPYNAIDPHLLVTNSRFDSNAGSADAKFYLTWGSYWQGIYGANTTVHDSYVSASRNQVQLAYQSPREGVMEGAFVYPHDGYYYLFLSLGRCCGFDDNGVENLNNPYHVKVCRSSSPEGPFVGQDGSSCRDGGGTLFLSSHDEVFAPGGGGVLHDPEHGHVYYYHYLNKTIGYGFLQARLGWNAIQWKDGWPTLA